MPASLKQLRILLVDYDHEDIELIKESLQLNQLPIDVKNVDNGQALLQALKNKNNYGVLKPKPHLIIMDLNMPRKDGFETLQELKLDKDLRGIPVIILSTSQSPLDIAKAYHLGASCFISKPRTSGEWCSTMGKLGRFWLECASLSP